MSSRKPGRRSARPVRGSRFDDLLRELRGQPDAEDGVDPRHIARRHRREEASDAPDRKLLQLCEQVRRALVLSLSALSDPVLLDLDVAAVTPSPDASRLRVTVRSRAAHLHVVRACLDALRGPLRHDVAQAVRRRRAPDLVFDVVPAAEGVR